MVEGRRLSKDDIVTWQRLLNKKGWAVPHWPKEWGGTGWTPIQQYIYVEEREKAPAPEPVPFGTAMVGPVIIAFGNEAQKKKYLPRIANIDDFWVQGFSEPGAGSDLASLKTTAKRVGDHYVVNGQKTWTTYAQYGDWIFCLVRTDPAAKKQEGISFLLIDMKTKGITVRPIQTIDGGHEVNEVFFDEVKVPVENLIGQENRGWDYAKFLLEQRAHGNRPRRNLEGAHSTAEGTRLHRARRRQAAHRRRTLPREGRERRGGTEGARDAAAPRRGGKTHGRQQAGSRLIDSEDQGIGNPAGDHRTRAPGRGSLRAAVRSGRGAALRNEPPIGPEWAAPIAPTYFNYRKVSIYGGSNEIQKNIIAKAVLGL